MKDIGVVILFTIREHIRKKSFLVTTLLMLVLSVLTFSLTTIINMVSEMQSNSTNSERGMIYIIDEQGIVKKDVDTLAQAFPDYTVEVRSIGQLDQLKTEITDHNRSAIAVVQAGTTGIVFDYYVEQAGHGLDPEQFEPALRAIYVSNLLNSSGVSQEITQQLPVHLPYTVTEVGGDSVAEWIASMFGMVLNALLFFLIYFFAYGVAMSVASEKTSRVMELLVTSLRPSKIVLGKTIAMGIVGFCQFALLLLTSYLSHTFIGGGRFAVNGLEFKVPSITPLTVIIILVYFVMGYFLYAFMNAVAGALVSKAEDVQSALMPVSMIAVLAFYLSYFSNLSDSSSSFVTVVSIVPFSSPFSMPTRILTGSVPLWELATSLGALLAFVALIAWLSIRLYSAAVLHYGNKISIIKLFKMSR